MGLLEDGVSRCEQLFLTLPDGWGDGLREKLRSGDAEDLLSVADEVARALGAPTDGEYRRWLRETVGELRAGNRDVIAALKDLEVPIATTNYDSLIEEATGLDPVTWRDDARIARVLRKDEAGILHLHGHWEDPESVVLGIRSYEDVLGDARAQFIQQAITAFNSLLFVGCGEGLKDPNFSALRRWLVQFAGWEYRHFRLALQSEARAVAGEHEPAEHIAVVVYGQRHDDLAPFLRKLRPPGRPAPEPAQGSSAGCDARDFWPRPAPSSSRCWACSVSCCFGQSGTAPTVPMAIPDRVRRQRRNRRLRRRGRLHLQRPRQDGQPAQPARGRAAARSTATVGWKLVQEDSGKDAVRSIDGQCSQPFGASGHRAQRLVPTA